MKILVADDSRTSLAIISSILTEMGHEVTAARGGQEVIQLFQQSRPDLIILDVVMEGMDGFECAKKLRALDSEDWIPIIFLSGSVDDSHIAHGIDAGGDDYLTKPFSQITLSAKIKAMQRIADMRKKLFEMTRALTVLSVTDPLTGLYNRLQFDRVIHEKVMEADREHLNIALMFIDLDKFKAVNDTLGHHYGDLLLQEVARRLKQSVRSEDVVARLGGDEFAIIISALKDPDHVDLIAKKILHYLEQPCVLEDQIVHVGASIGITFYPSPNTTQNNILKQADTAMYRAKQSGRNRHEYFVDSSFKSPEKG